MTDERTLGEAPQQGEMEGFDTDEGRIAVANVDGALHAFSDICTHEQCHLSDGDLDGTTVTCPCHGSQFDVTSGQVLQGPAVEPVAVYEVEAENGSLKLKR